ncbi:hypothetical protein BCV69DRAFT_287525 [Microstroma glucosiphilum]|uniref:Sin-like protein conserved region domain-containing protein n=1 Tax=Pseudomicrostroma glucosiphilum TaxID=1684307 RepID=A0A316U6B4_9BASI|nr:hypothetical protein BCV69DRAFT_287525 [Pseudomicrostroma glucosiphilum]PWN20769.1 hypothetical protein BCV69DRAFT_287525 [Pseudomicrostroma glucosiphilum]
MADDDAAAPSNQNVDSAQGDSSTAGPSEQDTSTVQDDDEQDAKPEFDDPNLLASYPIYLSHSIPSTSSLQLFQYPTYPNKAPLPLPNYSRERGLTHAIRWRPNAGWVQVELPLDLRAALYHKEKGEEMAKGAEKMGGQIGSGNPADDDAGEEEALPWARRRGSKKSSRANDSDEEMAGIGGARGPSRKLEKMRLESEVMPHMTKYCVGVMRDQALHLTQLDRILQLRPSMHHLDGLDALEAEDKRNAAKAFAGEQTGNESEGGEGAPHPAAAAKKEKKTAYNVGVKFNGTPGGPGAGGGGGFGGRGQGDGPGYDARDALMASRRRAEGENWVELEWRDLHGHHKEDVQATISSQLFAGSKAKLKCRTKPRDYLPASLGSDPPMTAGAMK